MKMSEIQCSKFTFAGSKLRILGKISQTVQCVMNGKIEGNVHVKANVVEDLKATFDTHSIAGMKMTKLLSSTSKTDLPDTKPSSSTLTGTPSTPRSRTAGSTRSSPAPPTSTPSRSSPAPSVSESCHSGFGGSPVRSLSSGTSSSGRSTFSTPSAGCSSPPGFPSLPQYSSTRYLKVAADEPSGLLDKPPPGYVRRLQLKPEKNRFRNWHQGRVVRITRPGLACVDVLRQDDDPRKEYDGDFFTEYCQYPGLNVSVNDAVLYHGHDNSPELSWNDAQPHIRVIYNEEEVEVLRSHGVKIPDCPPEMLPRGYYG